MRVPERRVHLEGAALEVRHRVEPPPLLDELGDGLSSGGVELSEALGALEGPDLCLEGAHVGGSTEGAIALDTRAVVPADSPDAIGAPVLGATLATLRAHAYRFEMGIDNLPLPRSARARNDAVSSVSGF
jgi:hypothetical protein